VLTQYKVHFFDQHQGLKFVTILASQPSISANCSLVLLLWQGFDCEQVEKVSLLAVKLVIGLVTRASF